MITYDRLKLIIPPDQALANKALQVSLQQIKNIGRTTCPQLGTAFSAIETNANLPAINALTQPLPSATANFYANAYATGSGPGGTLYLTDVIGFPVGGTGNVYSDAIGNVFTIMNTMSSTGKFNTLINLYTTMRAVNSGVYGDPVTGPIANVPGAGNLIYSNATVCYANLLIPEAVANTNSIISSNPNSVAKLNTETNYLASAVVLEVQGLLDAGIDIFQTQNGGRTVITSFVQSMPEYGKDTTFDGPAWYLEQVTDTGTIGGQSVIGVMREGRNSDALFAAGLGQDTAVPDNPQSIPPQANLIPSTTSASAAANAVVQ
jgi:biotin operon repressor